MELLQAGFTVTWIGMGVVFVLLTLLVGVVHGMSRIAQAIEGIPTPSAAAPSMAGDEELVGVISAAVAAYRRKR
jgi:sodium pump decarboxylase gamma subunit